jgi:farnesol kinase
MWPESPLLRDAGAAVLTAGAAMAVLRLWEEVGNRALLDQVSSAYHLNRSSFLFFVFLSVDDCFDLHREILEELAHTNTKSSLN